MNPLVSTLCVGTHVATHCVESGLFDRRDAERRGLAVPLKAWDRVVII